MAEAAKSVTTPVAASTTEAGLLGFVAELGDAAYQDGVDAEQLAELRSAGRISAVRIREILFRHDFVECLAFDHRVGAVLYQSRHQQIGNALADIDVRAEK